MDCLSNQHAALDRVAVAAPKLDHLYSMIGHCISEMLPSDTERRALDARA
jgi:hypothetical protein